MTESSRNWADLPGDITSLISKKLPADRIYVQSFRAVCKNWRTAVSRSEPQPQLPWLIECKPPDVKSILGPNLRFYSLAGGDTGTIPVPEPYRGMVYYGLGHSYILLSSLEDDLNLLSPLTGDLIKLPKLINRSSIHSPGCSSLGSIDNWHVACYVRVNNFPTVAAAIYHADQNEWTCAKVDFWDKLLYYTCRWGGKVFTTGAAHSMDVFDAFSGEMVYKVLPPEDEVNVMSLFITTHLVESCGEILRVCRYFTNAKGFETEFVIYKLYSGEGQNSWIKIGDIGDQIVFLDLFNGFSMRAPAGCKGNCIYFLSEYGHIPSRYDIDTKTVERVPCPFTNTNCTWFIPNLG